MKWAVGIAVGVALFGGLYWLAWYSPWSWNDIDGDIELHPSEIATVTRVIDGDTIEVDGDEVVRLIGIDAPETVDPGEPVECYGPAASAFTSRTIPKGTHVRLEYDEDLVDPYERTLAYVFFRVEVGDPGDLPEDRGTAEVMLNELLVRRGYATVTTFPPNVRYVDTFIAAERHAREQGLGLWSACGRVSVSSQP